uniref:Uncharacterized protein n=1 Tax=Arundo donax TaxID=35708 RepID=A0A0A9BSQ9_ARUDO
MVLVMEASLEHTMARSLVGVETKSNP